MTTEYQPTREEEACDRLLTDIEEMIAEAAYSIVDEAEFAAYAHNLLHHSCLDPEEYEEAMHKMRLAATELSRRDHELLEKLCCTALAAAASIDPEDRTPAGYRVDRGSVH